MTPLHTLLETVPLIAILRGLEPAEAEAVGEGLFNAGWRCLEVPLNSPRPLDSIARLSARFAGRMLVGAGTVLEPHEVKAVAAAGGAFIVSPDTNVAVIAATKAERLLALPGFFTPSEAFRAVRAGADALKLFPAELAGPAGIRAIKAVLPPSVPLIAVGGITVHNLRAYRRAGAAGFGIGSAVYKPGSSPEQVETSARAFVVASRASR